ncbi:TIM-barrel domain-containing protein [Actinomyces lilanjuaniae]|uniref:glycoside hydrolase family 31 protein n=1 Tax=Actinomyces lilanjuaniae TaxID=2321394 RepID=UPI001FAB18B6|nr:TIM-barrel domain-containing protein [Actinomyces lilanjuaniae]
MTSPLSRGPSTPRPAPARPQALVTGPTYRFTVLTSRLIRMEYSPTGAFTDAATQLVTTRDLGEPPAFRVMTGPDRVEVVTEHLHLTHVPSLGFTRSGLNVRLRRASAAPHGGAWYHGDTWDPAETFPTNLGGTTRTLDEVDGRAALDPGLLSLTGIAVLDDSASLLLTHDEWVEPRASGCGTEGGDSSGVPREGSADDPHNTHLSSSRSGFQGTAQELHQAAQASQDLYLFGYAQDYRAALNDFFRLTGPSPLIPRALLGNWWSRYHAYSAEEYLALMDRFAAEGLPFSVAVIDMDWHLVDIDPAIGTGWTGYTWNHDLFPDPRSFLEALHQRGMLVTLNVHPAQGVRRHEEAYQAVCHDLGLDPAAGEDVPFSIADRDFVRAYLEQVHHPLEEQGVDFWWLDWQQGGTTTLPGLDPLWMLNHVHYLDSGRQGRRPVTFSRYADPSSHRTPVGFSGDTVATWDSLRFQPEFTATAANIGYYWWSNDIGGHMLGQRDDDMAARWVQLGCFSPVNRLHSTSSEFNSKEPWRYRRDARATMGAYLRLRHRLVPYLYTWARRSVVEGVGPVRPLYHDYPDQAGAYELRQTFLFGDLLVVPFTSPLDPVTGLGREPAWLPEGVWYDLPTGRRYDATTPAGEGSGRRLVLSRPLERTVVLARAGSVIPLAGSVDEPASHNPRELELVVLPGADGSTVLEEDDGSAAPGPQAVARTVIELEWPGSQATDCKEPGTQVTAGATTGHQGRAVVRVRLEGAAHVVPQARHLRLRLLAGSCSGAVLRHAQGHTPGPAEPTGLTGLSKPSKPLESSGLPVRQVEADGFTLGAGTEVDLGWLSAQELVDGVEVVLADAVQAPAPWPQEVYNLLEAAQLPYEVKDRSWAAVQRGLSGAALLAELEAVGLPDSLRSAVAEVL